MAYDVYLQGVLVSIRLFNYRPSAGKLSELRTLKRSALVLLCASAGAFAGKGRGDAEMQVAVLYMVDWGIFLLFYGWFSELLRFFCPCVNLAHGAAQRSRSVLTFQLPAKEEKISQHEIDGLPTEVFDEAGFAEEGRCAPSECAICLEPLVDGEEVNALPCEHCYHHVCLVEWLERMDNPTCPTCRQDVRGGPLKAGEIDDTQL